MRKKAVAVRKQHKKSEAEMTKALFAPSLILEGEDSDAYKEFFKRVWKTINPGDIIEEIWVRDYVRSAWEVMRYRDNKERLIKGQVPEALKEILEPLVNAEINKKGTKIQKIEILVGVTPGPTDRAVIGWLRGEPEFVDFVDALLAQAGLTMADVNARAMVLAMDEMLLTDQLLARVESTRNAALRDIEQWRGGFARQLRETVHEVIDAEFSSVETDNGSKSN